LVQDPPKGSKGKGHGIEKGKPPSTAAQNAAFRHMQEYQRREGLRVDGEPSPSPSPYRHADREVTLEDIQKGRSWRTQNDIWRDGTTTWYRSAPDEERWQTEVSLQSENQGAQVLTPPTSPPNPNDVTTPDPDDASSSSASPTWGDWQGGSAKGGWHQDNSTWEWRGNSSGDWDNDSRGWQ
jgi:hypothetical protein